MSQLLSAARTCPRRVWAAHGTQVWKRFKFSARPNAVASEHLSKSAHLLPATPARTRFAPSPTGYLHIGSLRTALYNFLLARATGGQFILRLEDTDRTRIVPDAERRLYEDLKWAGLTWDEGPDAGGHLGPYRQSERLEVYNQHARQLLDQGRAYRCFCTPEELDQMKSLSIQDGSSPSYPGTCSHIPPDEAARRAGNGEPHCVRFKCGDRHPAVHDLVYGTYQKPGKEDDFIIIKRDGYPTYHFANVIDDHAMQITHVVRGAEWLISTPRHVALYSAFDWKSPEFAHVGLLVDKNKQKLSKRHGNIDITSWRDRGTLPVALLNYVMLLGWSAGRGAKGTQEVMDLGEMIDKFQLKFTKGNIIVNDKDEFIQRSHLRRLLQSLDDKSFQDTFLPGLEASMRDLEADRLRWLSERAESALGSQLGPAVPALSADGGDPERYLKNVLELDQKSYTDARSYLERNAYLLWQVPAHAHEESLRHELQEQGALSTCETPDSAEDPARHTARIPSDLTHALQEILEPIDEAEWTKSTLEKVLLPFVKSIYSRPDPATAAYRNWGYHLVRWVLAALKPGPALIPTMELLGKRETMKRVQQALRVSNSLAK